MQMCLQYLQPMSHGRRNVALKQGRAKLVMRMQFATKEETRGPEPALTHVFCMLQVA